MNIKIRYSIIALFTLCALIISKETQGQVRIDTAKTQLYIPRPALEPVRPLVKYPTDAIDTLDTANEYIKVVLCANNTWYYYKTPDFQQEVELFDEYWDDSKSNPYGIEQKDLPDQWSIWLVDSLDQYHYPFLGKVHVRGKFGMRRGRRHQGIDLPLKTGDPIYATFTGRVRMSKYFGAFGNLVVIRHDNGIETFYAHLSQRNVEVGDWVRLFVLKKKFFNIYSNYEQDFEDEFKNAEEDKKEDAEREAMRWYTIKSGDTLGRIAINHNTTVSELCRLNGMTRTTTLKIGRKIRVR